MCNHYHTRVPPRSRCLRLRFPGCLATVSSQLHSLWSLFMQSDLMMWSFCRHWGHLVHTGHDSIFTENPSLRRRITSSPHLLASFIWTKTSIVHISHGWKEMERKKSLLPLFILAAAFQSKPVGTHKGRNNRRNLFNLLELASVTPEVAATRGKKDLICRKGFSLLCSPRAAADDWLLLIPTCFLSLFCLTFVPGPFWPKLVVKQSSSRRWK